MKNKKGFTLVELLAVIVILALIMGIAIVSIGNVVQDSRENVMFENAQSVIDAVKKTLAINFASPNGNSYGFNKAMLSSGGDKSAFGDSWVYRTKGEGDTEITAGLWELGTAPETCAANVASYITFSANGEVTLCLTAGAGHKYIDGSESAINAHTASALK